MSERRSGIGVGMLALLPVLCCIGLPLLLAAGISSLAFVLLGGVTLAVTALGVAIALLLVRKQRQRAMAPRREDANVGTPL